MKSFTREDLENFEPRHDFFVGIDSDGCAFDTMEIKQKECFCPVTIEKWHLASISEYARETWEFVNLYSQDRGCNRFLALLKTFDQLRERPEVRQRGVQLPELPALRAWTRKETKLGNPALTAEIKRTGCDELRQVLEWSLAINEAVARVIHGVPPFHFVRESLEQLQSQADVIVVSSTPSEALLREWREHKLDHYVAIIAGQEMGSKKEHLQLAAGGKYPPGQMLMIGDALGDLQAARGADTLFYPIIPGEEEASWERFHCEIMVEFLANRYTRGREKELLSDFERALPVTPPWRN
jgi:phosphoglycolate phosphatase-like HAD superfamily hydrolase